jgi:hypothetical protein
MVRFNYELNILILTGKYSCKRIHNTAESQKLKAESEYKYSCTLHAARCKQIHNTDESQKLKVNTNTAARFTPQAAREYTIQPKAESKYKYS